MTTEAIEAYRMACKVDRGYLPAKMKLSEVLVAEMVTNHHGDAVDEAGRTLADAVYQLKQLQAADTSSLAMAEHRYKYFRARYLQALLEYHQRSLTEPGDYVAKFNLSRRSYEHTQEVVTGDAARTMPETWLLHFVNCFDVGDMDGARRAFETIRSVYPAIEIPASLAYDRSFRKALEAKDTATTRLMIDEYWAGLSETEKYRGLAAAARAVVLLPKNEKGVSPNHTPAGEALARFGDDIVSISSDGREIEEGTAASGGADRALNTRRMGATVGGKVPIAIEQSALESGHQLLQMTSHKLVMTLRSGEQLVFADDGPWGTRPADARTAQILEGTRTGPPVQSSFFFVGLPPVAIDPVVYPGTDRSRAVVWFGVGAGDPRKFDRPMLSYRVLGANGYDVYLPDQTPTRVGFVPGGMSRRELGEDVWQVDGAAQTVFGLELNDLKDGRYTVSFEVAGSEDAVAHDQRTFEVHSRGRKDERPRLEVGPLILGYEGTAASSVVIAQPAINIVPNPFGVIGGKGVFSVVVSNLAPDRDGTVRYQRTVDVVPVVEKLQREKDAAARKLRATAFRSVPRERADSDSLDRQAMYSVQGLEVTEVPNRGPGGRLIVPITFDLGHMPDGKYSVQVTFIDVNTGEKASADRTVVKSVEQYRALLRWGEGG
jgi:hypothetical protein